MMFDIKPLSTHRITPSAIRIDAIPSDGVDMLLLFSKSEARMVIPPEMNNKTAIEIESVVPIIDGLVQLMTIVNTPTTSNKIPTQSLSHLYLLYKVNIL